MRILLCAALAIALGATGCPSPRAAASEQASVQSVDVSGDGNKCTFHFIGGVEKAVAAPASVTGVASETPPPDVAKVGDDQAFMTEGPVTQFYAAKGDAYVEVDGGFLPEGVSRWVLLPTLASRVLAARSTNP